MLGFFPEQLTSAAEVGTALGDVELDVEPGGGWHRRCMQACARVSAVVVGRWKASRVASRLAGG